MSAADSENTPEQEPVDGGGMLAPASEGSPPGSKAQPEQRSDKTAKQPDPHELGRILEKAPENVRREFLGMFLSAITHGPAANPFPDKVNDEHIHKALDIARDGMRNRHRRQCSDRWFRVLYFLGFSALFVFLVFRLPAGSGDILFDLIKLMAAVVGAVGAGYGLKSYLDSRE